MKLAVLIPSRDRPASFLNAVRSVNKKADVLAYFDDDMKPYPDLGGAVPVIGKRAGPAHGWRVLSEKAMEDGYDVMLTMTDDCIISPYTPDWNQWVEKIVARWPVCALSPLANNDGEHRCDMPAVTRGFVNAVGWFIHPDMGHYCWPSVIDVLAEGLCMFKAPMETFHIKHTQEGSASPSLQSDALAFYRWYAWHKDEHRAALKRAVANPHVWTATVAG